MIGSVIKKKIFILALKPYTLAVNFHTTPTIISWLEAQQPTTVLWDPTNTAHVSSIRASINENTLNTLQTALTQYQCGSWPWTQLGCYSI